MKLTVKTDSQEVTKEFHNQILLWDALAELGFTPDRPCGGRGTCGKCMVTANGQRVKACAAYLVEDTIVEDIPVMGEVEVLTGGGIPEMQKEPLVEAGFGMAIDIGTTTIAGYLYQFPEGRLIKTIGASNTQTQYGADVISRMDHAIHGGAGDLQRCLQEQIRELTCDTKVKKYVITGNTTMLHFLTGKDTSGMACAPYKPESLFGQWYGDIYLPKCMSAFVGADITCGILSSGMLERKKALLVDIGTNGEMVLWHERRLWCCSAAAGPAFEGAEISRGMLAQGGAINKVYVEKGEVKYTTIEGAAPRGICGSGLIDAIAVMLELGILDDTGYLEEPYEIPGSRIFITPEDVRQVQLAKSAIRSGIDTLLHEQDITCENLDAFYIAGGFGSYIDVNSAAKIGLIPVEAVGKAVVIGNAAGIGATMILQSKKLLAKAEKIAEKAVTLQLAESEYFAEKYIENMMFDN